MTHRPCSAWRRRLRGRGISLVETLMSLAIVSLVVVVSIRTYAASCRSQTALHDQQRGDFLVQELLSEISVKAYREPFELVAFGPEVSEHTGTRAPFDDVDDYRNWTEAPPRDTSGTPQPDCDTWSRDVSVEWVNADNLNVPIGTDSGIKRIAVSARREGRLVATAVIVRTDRWTHPWELD